MGAGLVGSVAGDENHVHDRLEPGVEEHPERPLGGLLVLGAQPRGCFPDGCPDAGCRLLLTHSDEGTGARGRFAGAHPNR